MPKPDYDDIDRLEHELFPEWFDEAQNAGPPKPPPSPPPPPKGRRKPGREEPLRMAPGQRWVVDDHAALQYANFVAASSHQATVEKVAFYGPKLRRVKIYGPNGELL